MPPAINMDGIVKAFGGKRVLDQVSFSAEWGQVHALLGENGAGKSSLMNVLAGLYLPEDGVIELDGVAVRISGPAHARDLGIGMVHQHFKLVRPFTVAENVMMANPQRSWRASLRHIVAQIEQLSSDLGFDIDPWARIDRISIAEQQRVEIIKVLTSGARFLVLDEPTAVLTDAEAERLLATVRGIAINGACVVLITHKLREVLEYADRVTVMRAGQTVAATGSEDLSAADLARLMVGTAPPDETVAPGSGGAEILSVTNLSAARDDGVQTVNDLSFTVHGGQIYGVAGVGGNGQTELAEVLMGVRPPSNGRVRLDSEDITLRHPRTRRRRGMSSIPADRFRHGLSPDLTVGDNFSITKLNTGLYGTFFWVSQSELRRNTMEAIEKFEIHGAGISTRAGLLSGGNAQKLVLARELSDEARLIVAHSPTRGLDVRACAAVREHLVAARDSGAAVLLISEDLDEILMLSDRVGVLNRGRIAGEFSRPVDRQSVGECMAGHA